MTRAKLEQLLAEGKSGDAIQLLLKDRTKLKKNTKKEILLISARLKKIHSQSRQGILSIEEESREMAKINAALFEIINNVFDIEDGSLIAEKRPWIAKQSTFVILLILALISIGYFFLNSNYFTKVAPPTFDLVLLFFEDEANTKVLETGEVRIEYEGKTEVASIQGGKIILSRLRNGLKGERLRINPKIPGYESNQINVTIPVDSNKLDIQILPESTSFKGLVLDTESNIQAGLVIHFQGYETITNSKGEFNLELPFPPGASIKFSIIENGKVIDQGKTTITDQFQNLIIER